MLHVRSNNLPNHCFRAFSENTAGEVDDDMNFAKATAIDFKVEWNRDVEDIEVIEEEEIDDETGLEVTNLLCNVNAASSAKLPQDSGYALNGGVENPFLTGVGINGVMFEYPYLFSERWQSQYYTPA
jgi:hypothetical protein